MTLRRVRPAIAVVEAPGLGSPRCVIVYDPRLYFSPWTSSTIPSARRLRP